MYRVPATKQVEFQRYKQRATSQEPVDMLLSAKSGTSLARASNLPLSLLHPHVDFEGSKFEQSIVAHASFRTAIAHYLTNPCLPYLNARLPYRHQDREPRVVRLIGGAPAPPAGHGNTSGRVGDPDLAQKKAYLSVWRPRQRREHMDTITTEHIMKILELTDSFGLHREAVVIPLATNDRDDIAFLSDHRLRITVPRTRPFDEWLVELRSRLTNMDLSPLHR